MKYLLDSNIVSEPSKPVPNEKVLENFLQIEKIALFQQFLFFKCCMEFLFFQMEDVNKDS